MTQKEVNECRAAAILYRQQRKQIARLQERIAVLEERMDKIDREDAEVIAIVTMKKNRRKSA